MNDHLPLTELRTTRPASRAPSRVGAWLRRIVWLLIALAVIGAIAWVVLRPHGTQAPRGGRFAGSGPMPVAVAPVKTGDMPVTLNALGTVTPLATVTVKTQINGRLVEIGFQEGQMVKQGDFLAQIDPRPFQIALDQAQGQLLRDQALLRNAELDLTRYKTLFAQDSIAKQQLDTQDALVKQYQGTIRADQAQVDNAKLNLVYCRIVAPVSGRLGLRQVDLGNYVQTSDANGIVVITQLQPITVLFTLPEDNLPAVMRRLHAGATLPVTALDRAQTNELATGTLATVDNQIDTSTGTVKLKALFANDDESLFPNQFVNARVLVDTLHDTTIAPASSIQRGAPGTFVYVLQPDETVAVRPVKLGPSDADRIAVLSGIKAGEQIVVDGADKLREGAKVSVPAAQPAAGAPAGTPADGTAPAPHGRRSGQPDGGQPSGGQPDGGQRRPRAAQP